MVYIFILPISASAIDIICNAVPVICLAVLAAEKNLGKNKTITIASVYVICRIVRLVSQVAIIDTFGESTMGIISSCIENLVTALAVAFATVGKYLDKAERHAE